VRDGLVEDILSRSNGMLRTHHQEFAKSGLLSGLFSTAAECRTSTGNGLTHTTCPGFCNPNHYTCFRTDNLVSQLLGRGYWYMAASLAAYERLP
jgi:hypothetical protein